MNEKEAREIIKDANGIPPKPYTFQEGMAKGYLEAHEKAKGLVEAMKDMLCVCGNFKNCKHTKALAKFKEEER